MKKALVSGTLISAVLILVPMILPTSGAAPFNVSARADEQKDLGVAADRIGGAFALLSEDEAVPAISAAAARAMKGDFAAPACANAVWPNIDASCLATVDGRPAPYVRTITIGYQAGESTTVLVRIPVTELAHR